MVVVAIMVVVVRMTTTTVMIGLATVIPMTRMENWLAGVLQELAKVKNKEVRH